MAIKVQDLPTTTTGATGDFLIKDKVAGGSGATQKMSIASFISFFFQSLFDAKQDVLAYTPEDVANKDTDVTLAANSDTKYPSQKAIKTYSDLKIPLTYLDTDTTLAANSDTKLATQKAVKAYADQLLDAANAMIFKGAIDCSANPNYPAASAGYAYRVSVAGKIGGASGINVEIGDLLICITDGTSSGTQAGVGANWIIEQANIDGAVTGPASSVDANIALFNGTSGKIIKESSVAISTDGTFAANSDAKIPTEKAVKTYTAAYAPLASPALTGTPTAPTPSGGDNSTKIATTAFVVATLVDLDFHLVTSFRMLTNN